jgi:A/G-specific adenine glycosylase
MKKPGFAELLLRWYDVHGRKDLPWQHPRSAYRVWLSEVMLQQTQVITVIGYFQRFLDRLPTLPALAAAHEDDVLALWAGLGYYRRARFLHAAAKQCVALHDGELPRDLDALCALPGIGRSTAGAILAQAYGLRFPILDGNVKRVLTRYHGIAEFPGETAVEKKLWALAEQHTPAERLADYTQAIMDLGATLCVRVRPLCPLCPLNATCVAFREHLTTVIPAAKPARAIPTRQTAMIVLRDTQRRILLEKRMGSGVWSGLWSLPEAIDIDHAGIAAAERATIGSTVELPRFVHVFSHYRLEVAPVLYDNATARPTIADNDTLRWCTATDAAALGLPAPVRTLLTPLLEQP